MSTSTAKESNAQDDPRVLGSKAAAAVPNGSTLAGLKELDC
jgi:hypothetical protein